MQKKTLLYLCLMFLLTSVLSAKSHPDRGAYGELSFLYNDLESKTNDNEHSQKDFSQQLKLGYKGNIYSPKLLDYTLEGLIRFDKRDTQKNSYTESRKTDSTYYRANLNFIKATKFPFTVYASKKDEPISTVYSTYTTNYIHETESQGITGSLNFEPYIFSYGLSSIDTIAEYDDRLQTIETNNYNTSFRYGNKSHNLQLKYRRIDQTNAQEYVNSNVVSVNQIKDTVNLTHKWRMSEALQLDSAVNYENDDYYFTKKTDARFNLRWRPKDADYDGFISMFGARTEYSDENGTLANTLDTMNVNQGLTYRLTPTLSLSENVMMYTFDSPSSKGSTTYVNLRASHNYKRTVFTDTRFNLLTRFTVQKTDTDIKTTNDTNTTANNTSLERYSLSVDARFAKDLPSIDSKMNFNTSCDLSTDSASSQQQRYNMNLLLDSKIFHIVYNQVSAKYMTSNSTAVRADGEKQKSSASSTSLMESLNFNLRLGIKGRATFKFGVEYANLVNDNETINRFDPRADVNLNYRLSRRWLFNSGIGIRQIYNTLEHSANANLSFRAGKTSFSMGYQYNKSEVDNPTAKIENERSSLRVKLARKF